MTLKQLQTDARGARITGRLRRGVFSLEVSRGWTPLAWATHSSLEFAARDAAAQLRGAP